ncbi:MAG: efflux RND transporter periplasmic adaptor subunit [Pseudomonadota bacterium]
MAKTEQTAKPSLLKRAGIVVVTLATLGFAAALVGAGLGVIAERANTETQAASTAPVTVETATIDLQDRYTVRTTYRGRIEAGRRLDIGFEAGGTVAEVLVDEGDKVLKGDVLARLDTAALEAQRASEVAARDALAAQVELAARTAKRARELNARDFASTQRLDETELTLAQLTAELRRAEAAIDATDVTLQKSVLTAPFDAEIGTRAVDDGARTGAGQTIVTLFEATAPRFRVGLPQDIAETLKKGEPAEVTINSETLAAVVERVRGDINPATRTRDAVLVLPEAMGLAQGTLGTLSAEFTVDGAGAWVPATALSEGARGLWTLFVIDDGVTRREAVELVHMDDGQAFVRGHLTDGTEIVATGPHRVAAGQSVVRAGS